MSKTFEELVTPELDALYQGALFLTGGDPEDAERLLVLSVTSAFKYHRSADEPSGVRERLEVELVRVFLSDPTEDRGKRTTKAPKRPTRGDEVERLYAGAADTPRRSRAALWLVLLLRWSYQRASDVLGVSIAELQELLAERGPLLSQLVPARAEREGGVA